MTVNLGHLPKSWCGSNSYRNWVSQKCKEFTNMTSFYLFQPISHDATLVFQLTVTPGPCLLRDCPTPWLRRNFRLISQTFRLSACHQEIRAETKGKNIYRTISLSESPPCNDDFLDDESDRAFLPHGENIRGIWAELGGNNFLSNSSYQHWNDLSTMEYYVTDLASWSSALRKMLNQRWQSSRVAASEEWLSYWTTLVQSQRNQSSTKHQTETLLVRIKSLVFCGFLNTNILYVFLWPSRHEDF